MEHIETVLIDSGLERECALESEVCLNPHLNHILAMAMNPVFLSFPEPQLSHLKIRIMIYTS